MTRILPRKFVAPTQAQTDTDHSFVFSKVDAVPTIFEAVVEAARKVESPLQSERDAGRNTLYDTW